MWPYNAEAGTVGDRRTLITNMSNTDVGGGFISSVSSPLSSVMDGPGFTRSTFEIEAGLLYFERTALCILVYGLFGILHILTRNTLACLPHTPSFSESQQHPTRFPW